MSSGRSFLVLLLVAAGLGSYIYFVEMKRDPASEVDTPAREKVFTFNPGSIEEVEITNASAEVTRVTKKDATWSLVSPVTADVDPAEIGTVLSSIESLERTKVIDEKPASAAPFGLEPARIRLAFKTTGDAAPKVLLIGNKTPTGGDLYAKVDGSPAVFLIGGYLEDTFNKKTFDFREKTALKFVREDVTAVTITQGASKIALEKRGDDWRLTSPAARADSAAVDALISQLQQARMTSIAAGDASAAALKERGLDKPQLTVTVGVGSAKAELAIGKAEDDTHYFARDLSRPMIFSVDKTLFDGLAKKVDDFRVKDVFAFRSFTATAIEIAYGGQTYSFAKKKENDTAVEKWSQTAPAAKVVDAAKFDEFLLALSNLRAESFAAAAHSGGESVTVTAKFGDAAAPQTETVTLRKVGTIVHAIRSDEPGAASVSTADFDKAMALFRELTGAK